MLEKHCVISPQVRGFYSGYWQSGDQMWHGYSILLSVVRISTAALFGGSPDGENAFIGSNKTKCFRLRVRGVLRSKQRKLKG